MIFYTDGSAHPNPGPGGFGVVILDNNKNLLYTYSKQYNEKTTNNEQEMKAILFAVLWAKRCDENNITIYSDSSYAINTFSNWMYSWERNGWIKSTGGVPENLEIVKTYFELSKNMKITFQKVKGHIGNEYNEMADKLATGSMKSSLKI